MRVIGTRDQVRAALDELSSALSIPREPASVLGGAPPFEGARTTRYSIAEPLSDGRWSAQVDAPHVALLSASLATLVAASLPDGVTVVSSTRWMRPWIVRAEIVDLPQDIPLDAETVEHLWDTSETDLVGTRYLRADGQREFVLQQIGNSTDHVFALWFAGASDDLNETAYARAMIAAATALGVVLESVECVYADGAWLVGEIAEGSTIASRWPSTWHVSDADGLPTSTRCIREVVL